ncbi:hypothetical protein D3C72_2245890 [compost metagenome]
MDIKSGQYIGISNSKIVAAAEDMLGASQALLSNMLENGDEIVTILTGQDADSASTEALTGWLSDNYPEAEVEVHEGGQPIYYYLFSVEA